LLRYLYRSLFYLISIFVCKLHFSMAFLVLLFDEIFYRDENLKFENFIGTKNILNFFWNKEALVIFAQLQLEFSWCCWLNRRLQLVVATGGMDVQVLHLIYSRSHFSLHPHYRFYLITWITIYVRKKSLVKASGLSTAEVHLQWCQERLLHDE